MLPIIGGMIALDCLGPELLTGPTCGTREAGNSIAAVSRDALHWARCEAEDCEKARRWPEAISYLDRLIAAEPTWRHYGRRARALAEAGQYGRATEDYARARELGGKRWTRNLQNWYEHGLVCAANGDLEGYRAVCTAALEQFQGDQNSHVLGSLVRLCTAAPGALADPTQIVKVAKRIQSKDVNVGEFASYRAGDYYEVIRRLGYQLPGNPFLREFYVAMAYHRLGNHEEARQWLDKGLQRYGGRVHDEGRHWSDRLAMQLLIREAEALIKGTKPESKK